MPVIRYFSDEGKELGKGNLYFAVYSNKTEEFQHIILYRKSKKKFFNELTSKGYNVHYVLNKNDVADVKRWHFTGIDVDGDVITYLVENISEWDLNF